MTIARDYQNAALKAAWCALQHKKAVQVVLPSGSGKTRVIAELADKFYCKTGGRTLIVAPMRELVLHAEREVTKYTKLSVSVEMAKQHARDTTVVCTTKHTIAARLNDFKRNAFGLVVFDESDLAAADTYDAIKKYFHKAKVFGATATPDRHDGRTGIAPVVFKRDLKEQIEAGFLSRVRRIGVKIAEVSRAKLQAGDFDPKWLDEIFSREEHLHEVVKAMLEKADKRPTLVFGVTVLHAKLLANLFNRYRPGSAQWISGKSKDQHATLDAFRRGEFQFLCNCMLVSRGVDIPPVACIGMAAPTLSHTKYMQMLGRGTRKSPGKKNLLVVDFTFNSDVHALDAVDVVAGEGKEEVGVRARERERSEFDIVDVINEVEGELESDPDLRARIRAQVQYKWRRIEDADEKKRQLLDMARRGEARPHSTKHHLGRVLNNYIAKHTSSYDLVFDSKIRNLAPDWFVKSAVKNKRQLLLLAAQTETRPHSDTKLGSALGTYISKARSFYDPVFDKEIHRRAPLWFYGPEEKKRELLAAARRGEERPLRGSSLDNGIRSYLDKSRKVYDSELERKLRNLAPHWFGQKKDHRKRAILIAMAKNGEEKPARNTALHKYLYVCSSPFKKELSRLAPHWFKFRVNTAPETKKLLLKMARTGKAKPRYGSPEAEKLRNYVGKTRNAYDPEFDKAIRRSAPHWFSRR